MSNCTAVTATQAASTTTGRCWKSGKRRFVAESAALFSFFFWRGERANAVVDSYSQGVLKYETLAKGRGEESVGDGDMVGVDFVLRRNNGYFLYSSQDCGVGCGDGEAEAWDLAEKEDFIAAIPLVLRGMKKGEVRKVVITPEFGYAKDLKLRPQPRDFGQKRQIEA